MDKMHPPVICVAGEIASGKTYVANLLAQRKTGVRYSPSDYLKQVLLNEGVSNPSRKQLQHQGVIEIEKGWNAFAQAVLSSIPIPRVEELLVIDGVRHLHFYRAIKAIVNPRSCFLVYLDVDKDTIRERLLEREEDSIEYCHVAEGNLIELKNAADYVNYGDIGELYKFVDSLT